VLRWFLNEPGAAAAAAALSTPGLAPDLVVAEIGNGLWSALRRQRIDEHTARALLASAPQLFQELRPANALANQAFAIACALKHPIYDCFYLALAEAEGASLLTFDTRLQAAVKGTPWEILVSTP
jgi:predicted nucleic acid-binding protein